MYVGQTSSKLIGGGAGYSVMTMDVGMAQPTLMMDPADCLGVRIIKDIIYSTICRFFGITPPVCAVIISDGKISKPQCQIATLLYKWI